MRRNGRVPNRKRTHAHPQAKHNPFTHFPKDPNCPICNETKSTRSQCRSKTSGKPDELPKPLKFGDSITADHKILNDNDASRQADKVALIILDRYSRWLQGYACKTKSTNETVKYLKRFVGPQFKPEHVYSDNSKELIGACEELEWPHDTSTPHRSETNGCIERSVRTVKEGTSGALVQSGLDDAWWPQAMACFCFLRVIYDLLDDDKTAYERRFNAKFTGPVIPFGAEITYLPISDKDKKRVHQFGSKVLSGIFLGYDQQEGGGWSGDLMVLDWEEIENASHFSDIHIKRFKSSEVNVHKVGENFRFPLAEGVLRQPGSERNKAPRQRSSSPRGAGGTLG